MRAAAGRKAHRATRSAEDRERPDFSACVPQLVRLDESAKIVVFERDDLYFCFNFHPDNSCFDYGFEVRGGVYRAVLDSDAAEFGGFALRTPGEEHFPVDSQLRLYLPCRTALVLARRDH